MRRSIQQNVNFIFTNLVLCLARFTIIDSARIENTYGSGFNSFRLAADREHGDIIKLPGAQSEVVQAVLNILQQL